jgi:hypothetical protein
MAGAWCTTLAGWAIACFEFCAFVKHEVCLVGHECVLISAGRTLVWRWFALVWIWLVVICSRLGSPIGTVLLLDLWVTVFVWLIAK